MIELELNCPYMSLICSDLLFGFQMIWQEMLLNLQKYLTNVLDLRLNFLDLHLNRHDMLPQMRSNCPDLLLKWSDRL